MSDKENNNKYLVDIANSLKKLLEVEKPHWLSLEQFEKYITIVKNLIDNKDVYLFFYPQMFRFDVDEKALNAQLHSNELTSREFQHFLHKEFTQLFFSLITEESDEYIESIFEGNEKLIAKKKLQLIETKIYNEAIKRRYYLSKLSVNSLLSRFDWEINEILSNREGKLKTKVKSATLRIELSDSRESKEDKVNVVRFDCGLSDIEFLINELTKVKELL